MATLLARSKMSSFRRVGFMVFQRDTKPPVKRSAIGLLRPCYHRLRRRSHDPAHHHIPAGAFKIAIEESL
jgi:hypothetical protein